MNELESRWRDLGAFIREQRQQGHVSLRKLSESAGISNPYLSQIERGLRKPSAEILQQIAKALRISAETLYVQAGILEAREGDEDFVMALLRDPLLHEEQKQTLLRIYQSFVFENGPPASTGAEEDGAAAAPLAAEGDGPPADADEGPLADAG